MFVFQVQNYGPIARYLLEQDRPNELGPGTPRHDFADSLSQLNMGTLFSEHDVVDEDMARCCIAGLWLKFDFLDEAHEISQSVHSNSGSYWHGIMHRREPDYSNAKYWFRRVGTHKIFSVLSHDVSEMVKREGLPDDSPATFLAFQHEWDPAAFVDLCQAVARGASDVDGIARRVAQLEWQILFDACFWEAVQPSSGG